MGLGVDDLFVGGKVQNARTSRTKTLIPLRSWEVLDSIVPVRESIRAVCERIGSTGLYPYVVIDSGRQIIQARQFPKNSGYLEDPATGIAAAALFFGLFDGAVEGFQLGRDRSILVRQGWSMGRPSEIEVRFRYSGSSGNVIGCWISGKVRWLDTVSD